MSVTACPPLLSDHDVVAYGRAVRSHSRHTIEEERDLIVRYQRDGDMKARTELLNANLWLSTWCARKFSFSNLSEADLIQEASIGILKAIDRYDTSVSTRFSSYAVTWAKAEVYNFVVNNWRSVKVATTKAKRRVFQNLYRHVEAGEILTDSRIAEIAERLAVKTSDVFAVASHMRNDVPMDGYSDGEDGPSGFLDTLGCEEFNPEIVVLHESEMSNNKRMASSALEILNDRERDIINSRVVNDDTVTLDVLSERYGVSMERIRQLQKNALTKMGDYIMAA